MALFPIFNIKNQSSTILYSNWNLESEKKQVNQSVKCQVGT